MTEARTSELGAPGPDPSAGEQVHESESPRIKHCTFFVPDGGEATIMAAGHQYYTVTGQRLSPDEFMTVKRYLDGSHTLAEVSARTGMSMADLVRLTRILKDAGLIEQPLNQDQVPADDFARLIEETCGAWTRQMSAHLLFNGLAAHSLPKEVFLGLILETYHYVKSSPRHVATAIAHCTDPGTEALLAEFFAEEYDHAEYIVQALERLGIPRDQTARSYPGSGTLSLIHMLCDIARRDTLAYLASIVFAEARHETFEAASKSLLDICDGYGWPADVIEPVMSHVRIDLEAGHSSLLAQAVADRPAIPVGQAHAAVNALHDLKHAFDQYYDSIVKYYSNKANHIPRQPVGYYSL